jgi:pectinesterase
MRRVLALLCAVGASAASPDAPRLVVAADGSGDYRSVQEAVDAASRRGPAPVTLFIRKGRYEELVRIPRARPNLRLVGEDRQGVVIACTNNDRLHPGVTARAVMVIEGDGCALEDLTVHNTTPYRGSQAEAVCVKADRCVFRRVDFRSFQDTLNLNGRLLAVDCLIEGDVDYIWGRGPAVFERCELRTMHDGYVVQARNAPGQPGFVFRDCRLTATPETRRFVLARVDAGVFPGSHVAFIGCRMPATLKAEGWLVTGQAGVGPRFEEQGSMDPEGRALDLAGRRGGRVLGPDEAAALTAAKVLAGADHWEPGR